MDGTRTFRVTPWVSRILILNGAGFLLLSTVFTAPRFIGGLAFDPAAFLPRPWTAITHLFVHESLLHFAVTSLALFLFGPPVERRLGGRRFAAFYLYCGVGAALFTAGLSPLLRVEPVVGPSGALFGVVLAFVSFWPDRGIAPVALAAPIGLRALFGAALVADALAALASTAAGVSTGLAHVTHLGGAAAGYLFFRLQAITARPPAPRPAAVVRRAVVTPMRVQEAATGVKPLTPGPDAVESGSPNDGEVDRVLDKISQFGIDSLTLQERKFLADVAERKRREQA